MVRRVPPKHEIAGSSPVRRDFLLFKNLNLRRCFCAGFEPETTDSRYGTTFSKNWNLYANQWGRKKNSQTKRAARVHDKPFKPSNPSKKGYQKQFSRN